MILQILSIGIFVFYQLMIMRKLKEDKADLIEREQIFQDWLFTSLYSINNKVLLPTEQEKPLSNKPATVYSPEDDPMNEFKRSDF